MLPAWEGCDNWDNVYKMPKTVSSTYYLCSDSWLSFPSASVCSVSHDSHWIDELSNMSYISICLALSKLRKIHSYVWHIQDNPWLSNAHQILLNLLEIS